MIFKLVRFLYSQDGIFSKLYNEVGEQIAYTLEHAYGQTGGGYGPKVTVGTYKCTRHTSPKFGYETWMLENVPGHTYILIHIGNYDHDSDGCILIGEKINGVMILNSRVTFNKFMDMTKDEKELTLTIKGREE